MTSVKRAWLAAVLTALMVSTGSSTGQETRPNFLLIVIDDVGWGELGFQGNDQIPTPNMDSLAAGGVRFTQGYVTASLCAPSRAGLLTGTYQTRFGAELHGYQFAHGIPRDRPTLAEELKELGYDTMAIGKWGVGDTPGYLPMQRGFDDYYGNIDNGPFYFPPHFIDTRVSDEPFAVQDPAFYTTDKYGERAVRWISQRQGSPWFLYLAYNAAHVPIQPRKSDKHLFLSIRNAKRRDFARVMSALDDSVGAVLDRIRELGQENNTFIVLLSDNGGPTWETTAWNGGLRGVKNEMYEGGIRIPFCIQWLGHLPSGATYDYPVSSLDVFPTFLAAAGAHPSRYNHVDGVNLLGCLRGEDVSRPHPILYWRMGDQWAIRVGDWKLVRSDIMVPQRVGPDGRGVIGILTPGVNHPELFNLAVDPRERHDLIRHRDTEALRLRLQSVWKTWSALQAPPL